MPLPLSVSEKLCQLSPLTTPPQPSTSWESQPQGSLCQPLPRDLSTLVAIISLIILIHSFIVLVSLSF